MKNIVQYFLLALTFTSLLTACKKDEQKIILENGTPPVLSASSTTALPLTNANGANFAVRFNWTNPNYRFTTGVSSQDVNYLLQIDTTGASFSSPAKQEVSISKDLSKEFTQKELNGVITKLNLLEDIPHNVEFRIKATLVNGSAAVYSNVIKMVITPYLDVAVPVPPSGELYITGNALPSDWTNSPPASQKFTKISSTEYTITVPFTAGKQYKFVSNLGNWQPQYGGASATGGDLGYNMGLPGQSDPAAIPTPASTGNYKITVNFKTGTYTVVQQ